MTSGRRRIAKRFAAGAAAAAVTLLTFASPARAADVPQVDRETHDELPKKNEIDRTWLYADDARVAAPLTVVALTSVSYTDAGANPTRIDSPFPSTYKSFAANTAQPGAMMALGGEIGLISRLSVMAVGTMGAAAEGSSPNAGALAGLRLQLFPSTWTAAHLVASGGYLREAWQGPVYDDDSGKWTPGSPHGDNGAWMQLAFSGDVRRLRLAATMHGEHIFSDGRDPLDVMVTLGTSYRIIGDFRAGLEYVGQDLEESFTPAAEAGARHFAGPMASLQLLQHRLSIALGPAFGLSPTSPRLLGRLAVAYAF